MKEQIFTSANDLKAEFDRHKRGIQGTWSSYHITDVITALSRALGDLRDSGVEVQLNLTGELTKDAAALIRGVSECSALTIGLTGILKIGQVENLLTLSVKEGENDVLKIYVSDFDYRGQGANTQISGKCFDLNDDAGATHALQQHIIYTAAKMDVIRDHDVSEVFDREPGAARLSKPLVSSRQLRP